MIKTLGLFYDLHPVYGHEVLLLRCVDSLDKKFFKIWPNELLSYKQAEELHCEVNIQHIITQILLLRLTQF